MPEIHVEPWIPPVEPGLARLAMEAADRSGTAQLRSWPERKGNGVSFGGLPTFAVWRAFGSGWHLVLAQARELGALVPGARVEPLPEDWLERLDLTSLAGPLASHPDFAGGASVHVVRVLAPGRAEVRSSGPASPTIVAEVLRRLSGIQGWRIEPCGGPYSGVAAKDAP